ncbi:MAG: lytic transglycosylase domain-containing protein [Pseudomonadales bacterium]
MSIDPLDAFAGIQANISTQSPVAVLRPYQQSFETLLGAAIAGDLSAQAVSREENRLARLANLQLLQGLFDPNQGAPVDSLSVLLGMTARQFEMSSAISQKLDVYASVSHEHQSGSLTSTKNSREQIEKLIDGVAQEVGLAPELIRSVVSTESNFSPDAVSSTGAQGLMQLMPATARELEVTDSFDLQQNLLGGSRYLKQLLNKYEGDLDYALAAYNWGQGNVDRKGLGKMPQETRDYLVKVKQGLAKQSA